MKRCRLSFNLIKKVYILYEILLQFCKFFIFLFRILLQCKHWKCIYDIKWTKCCSYPKLKSSLTVSKIYLFFINSFSHILKMLLTDDFLRMNQKEKHINCWMKKIKHLNDRLCAFFVIHQFENCRLYYFQHKIFYLFNKNQSHLAKINILFL